MKYNQYMNRSGKRAATSEIIMRNTYNQYAKQYYLVVEGESDEKFFQTIIDCNVCKVQNLANKESVLGFMKKRHESWMKGVLAIVDADFDHIRGKEQNIPNLLYLDHHDMEITILSSEINKMRLYSEHGNIQEILQFQEKNKQDFLEAVLKIAYQIGCLRLANEIYDHGISMNPDTIPYVDVINKCLQIDMKTLVERIHGRVNVIQLLEEYEDIEKEGYDRWQICVGHDVTQLLSLCFTNGSEGLGFGRSERPMRKQAIEQTLRNIYDYTNFKNTDVYLGIVKWQNDNNVAILVS